MQSIADELVERHHHANRIARKPEEVRVANLAVRERTAGLHSDLPEQDFTELVQKLLDGTTRLTAAKDDCAALQVHPRKATILPGFANRTRRNRNAAGNFGRALLHHDSVCAFRHHRASENAHGFAGTESTAVRVARE